MNIKTKLTLGKPCLKSFFRYELYKIEKTTKRLVKSCAGGVSMVSANIAQMVFVPTDMHPQVEYIF